MGIQISSKLGIISCPGGEDFARSVTDHLTRLFKRDLERKTNDLAKKYGLPREEIVRKFNLNSEFEVRQRVSKGSPDEYVIPRFHIPVEFTRFANGEFKATIESCVRGMDLYIFQDVENHYPIFFPNSGESAVLSVNDHLMCLLTVIDAAVQAGATTITLVVPAYPYSRQHKRKGREALTAAWFARMCEFMGVDRILTLDIHSTEIQNSCKTIALENMHASYQIMKKLCSLVHLEDDDLVIVSPDTGAVNRNKFYADNLKRPLAMLYKERDYSIVTKNAGQSNIKSIRLLGDVNGKNVFMADDMLGTGGTLIKAMRRLKEMGAKNIFCGISLPLFTGNAIEAFDEAYAEGCFCKIIGTNSVFHDETLLKKEWYISASVSELFAQFIMRLHYNESTSPLLENIKIIQKLLNP
ncbi:MAG: ribose-phosphate diphosphokinase [Spirochaetia bacterium]|nr:ribose-phosphate diphosphokinase [Spirochaetia bacterium]